MLFKEIIAVYCENHTEHTNTLWGQNAEVIGMLKKLVRNVKTGFYRFNELILIMELYIFMLDSVVGTATATAWTSEGSELESR
jgi:hypothetical protein